MPPSKPINSLLPFNEEAADLFWKSFIPFEFTRGHLPIHHLLMHAVKRFADLPNLHVNIMTFSIGEEALRSVMWIKEIRPDACIRVILDSSCRSNKMKYLIPFQEQAEVRFNHIHAKAFQVMADEFLNVAVVSTANLQSKTRWEIHNRYTNALENLFFLETFNNIWNESAP